jgi:hypothetical protein
MEDGVRESGRIPRTLECELTNDLVDACVPGDIATVSGEVKVVSVDEGTSKGKKKEQTMFLLFVHPPLFVNSDVVLNIPSLLRISLALERTEYPAANIVVMGAIRFYYLFAGGMCAFIFILLQHQRYILSVRWWDVRSRSHLRLYTCNTKGTCTPTASSGRAPRSPRKDTGQARPRLELVVAVAAAAVISSSFLSKICAYLTPPPPPTHPPTNTSTNTL